MHPRRDAVGQRPARPDDRRADVSSRTVASDYGYKHTDTRRSVYAPVFRNALPEVFEAFDFADPSMRRRPAERQHRRAAGAVPDEPPVPRASRPKPPPRRLLAETGLDDAARLTRALPPDPRPRADGRRAAGAAEFLPAERSAGRRAAWARCPRAVRVDRFPVRELTARTWHGCPVQTVRSRTSRFGRMPRTVQAVTRTHHDSITPSMTRRTALKTAACGFGYLALAGLIGQRHAVRGAAQSPVAQPARRTPPALRAAGEARDLPVHAGRRQPRRLVRLQAGADQAGRQDDAVRRRPGDRQHRQARHASSG